MEDHQPNPHILKGWLLTEERADYWTEERAINFSVSRMEGDGIDDIDRDRIEEVLNGLDREGDENLDEVTEERIEIAQNLGINIYEISEFSDGGVGATASYLLEEGKSLDDISLKVNERGLNDRDLRRVLEGFYDEWLRPGEVARKIGEKGEYGQVPHLTTIERKFKQAGLETPSDEELSARKEPEEKRYLGALYSGAEDMFLEDWMSISEIEEHFNPKDRGASVAEVLRERIDQRIDPSDLGIDEPGPEERLWEDSPQTLAQDYEAPDDIPDQKLFGWMIERGVNSVPEMTRIYKDFCESGISYRDVEEKLDSVEGITEIEETYQPVESVDELANPRTRAAIESVYRDKN